MRTYLLLLAGVALACAPHPEPAPAIAPQTAWPSTRAERSGYLETSRYDDVVAFVEAVDAASPQLHATTFGYSMEGRALPLVVAGAPSASAAAVRGTGRTRVLVQANIHAGEVEGKEVAQMLLREIAQGRHGAWLDELTLLFIPIYNADGNDRVRLDNRAEQHGPLAGVGTRENAQGLDLNRDHTKLDSPEARSLIRLLDEYDPHVVIDLHTTNGTYHAYHLTYSPPLHPATDSAITRMLRERWLPDVTRAMHADGWLAWYYGNLPIREWGMTGERGWYTFDYRPRFNTHYAGLRNRFGILSEAYSYASFEDRIAATHSFVSSVLDWAAAHATEIRTTTARADSASLRGALLPVRARIASSGDTTILLGAIEERVNPLNGRIYAARVDSIVPERMPNYDHFAATELVAAPRMYHVPDYLHEVVELLRAHGIRMHRPQPGDTAVYALEVFDIDSTRTSERPFQGHHEREIFGAWRQVGERVPPDTWIVDMNQPLGRLLFTLLEPRSPDGVANWGLIDRWIEGDPDTYPIKRASQPVSRVLE